MSDGLGWAGAVLATFAASWLATAVANRLLMRLQVLDTPTARSSHGRPTPRGGGIGFLVVVLLAWCVLLMRGDANVTVGLLVGALLVALVSFADDLRSVPLAIRLAVQAAAVALALATFPHGSAIVWSGLPLPIDRLIAGLAWLWFINLFNFMDGIDGIAATEAAVVSVGIVVLALAWPALALPAGGAALIAAAALAFLTFNWPPARLFMGDVGSTGLGFVLGWLLLLTAARGGLAAALALPLFFVADATTTLVGRAWRGKPLGQAHRDHAYQHAVDAGLSHRLVTLCVAALGLALIAIALLAIAAPMIALAIGLALTLGLIVWLRTRRRAP